MSRITAVAQCLIGFVAGVGVGVVVVVALSPAAAQGTPIFFVGCPADGQLGPVAAPTSIAATPSVPPPLQNHLAYYASAGLGTLAPRGWHCFSVYGSDATLLFVTPEAHGANDLMDDRAKFSGPAVQVSLLHGDTSGRFQVARLAARLFPSARKFVKQVIDEDIDPASDFVFAPYPRDNVARDGANAVRYVTPADTDGAGTESRLRRNGDAIVGEAILLPDGEPDLVKIDVRLPPDMRDVTKMVLAEFEKDKGRPALTSK